MSITAIPIDALLEHLDASTPSIAVERPSVGWTAPGWKRHIMAWDITAEEDAAGSVTITDLGFAADPLIVIITPLLAVGYTSQWCVQADAGQVVATKIAVTDSGFSAPQVRVIVATHPINWPLLFPPPLSGVPA